MNPTTTLVSSAFPVVPFRQVLEESHGSLAGFSAVSSWLTCPERSRLQALGVRQRVYDELQGDKLSALAFGTLCHYLRGARLVHGHQRVEDLLSAWAQEIPILSFLKAKLLFRTYETIYPVAQESFEVVGVECEVISEVGKRAAGPEGPGRAILRTVRYDTVVRLLDASGTLSSGVFSFEAKTMSKGGNSAVQPYIPQAMCQVAIWNANPSLVAQYGPMQGVIFDCLLKTETPNIERLGPFYYSKRQQALALTYLCSPDNDTVIYRQASPEPGDPPGAVRFPRMLHACWGRWSPCPFIPLCHDEAYGDFEFKTTGEPYQGE